MEESPLPAASSALGRQNRDAVADLPRLWSRKAGGVLRFVAQMRPLLPDQDAKTRTTCRVVRHQTHLPPTCPKVPNSLVVNVSVFRTDTAGCKLSPISLRVYMTFALLINNYLNYQRCS